MNNLLLILRRDFIIQNKVFSIMKSNIQFLLLSTMCIALVCSERNADLVEYVLVFLVVTIPMTMIISARPIMRYDVSDGTMDLLKLTLDTDTIILSRFCCMFINIFVGFIIAFYFIAMVYALNSEQIIYTIISRFFLLLQVSAFSILIGCIDSYFRSNTEIIAAIIFPLIIPGVMITGMMIYDRAQDYFYISILAGIDFIFVPLALILSSYLLRNIHNL